MIDSSDRDEYGTTIYASAWPAGGEMLLRDDLERREPYAYQLGRNRFLNRLETRRRIGGMLTSEDVRFLRHGEDDYTWLDGVLKRAHTYEEGAAFCRGFYDMRDLAFDGQVEVEG